MEWYDKKVVLPADNWRVLVFAPDYPKNDPMRIRMISGQFVKTLTDATHWAIPNEPEQIQGPKQIS